MELRKLEKKDIPFMLEWMHDSRINCYFRFDFSSMTHEKVNNFIEESIETEKNSRAIHRAIVNEFDEYLGTISLKTINFKDKSAEYAICMRMSAHGTGVASKATKLILKIAFEELLLERVYLNVLSKNLRANRFYEKMGFVFEGESRHCIYVQGEWQNLKWYSMLREEYIIK